MPKFPHLTAMIADLITSFAIVSLASAAIGALLQYTRDQWRHEHPKHPPD